MIQCLDTYLLIMYLSALKNILIRGKRMVKLQLEGKVVDIQKDAAILDCAYGKDKHFPFLVTEIGKYFHVGETIAIDVELEDIAYYTNLEIFAIEVKPLKKDCESE